MLSSKENWIRVKYFLLLFTIAFSFVFQAENSIRLENPSFEGMPQDATVPSGWMPCAAETTPDILPGVWGVYQEASDGDTYMGLITRDNGTFESVGQRLMEPLKEETCYKMSLDLAHSDTYNGYNEPIKIRVWGTIMRCENAQLLYESPVISHLDWETYSFIFFTKFSFNYIVLEAQTANNLYTRGNILVDNCSTINVCERV